MARTFFIVVVFGLLAGCDPSSLSVPPEGALTSGAPNRGAPNSGAQAVPVEQEIVGQVLWVMDGDSVKFQPDVGESIVVRLDGIDAPEKGQAVGDEARDALRRMTDGRVVYLISTGTDKYGRTLGKLHDGQVFINGELIRLGMAWHYAQYNDDMRLAGLQDSARRNRVGLWGSPTAPIPPWEFRKQ